MPRYLRCPRLLSGLSPSLLLGLAVFAGVAAAGNEPVRIELEDGSVVSGELVSLHVDLAIVRSPSLGRVEVPADKIRTLTYSKAPSEPGERTAITDDVARSRGEAAAASGLESLRSDPLMQAIVSDADLMKRIHSGDLDSLIGDPRLRALSSHQAVRAMMDSLNQSQ